MTQRFIFRVVHVRALFFRSFFVAGTMSGHIVGRPDFAVSTMKCFSP
ncbi:hypothetical protein NOZE110980_06475 [Nocardioides zeicaulis]